MSILPSHKNGLVYLEHCRIVSADNRLTYIKKEDVIEKHFSLPHLNLNVLLLGPGTSITQSAARMAAENNLMFAFTAGGETPLYMASLNEYRPTEYSQAWMKMWLIDNRRLEIAKKFQLARTSLIRTVYSKYYPLLLPKVEPLLVYFEQQSAMAKDINELLGFEGNFVKSFYGEVSRHYGVINFRREPQEGKGINSYITHGNYLAYGIAGTVLWIMGIPFSLPLSHGTTRRGGLVFDVADLYKEALVLNLAFEHGIEGNDSRLLRKDVIDFFDKNNIIRYIFQYIKEITEIL